MMRKIRLQIEETLQYTKFLTIEFKNDISDKQTEKLLDLLERKASSAEDISYFLSQMDGVEVIEDVDPDLSSPDSTEVEIVDYVDTADA